LHKLTSKCNEDDRENTRVEYQQRNEGKGWGEAGEEGKIP